MHFYAFLLCMQRQSLKKKCKTEIFSSLATCCFNSKAHQLIKLADNFSPGNSVTAERERGQQVRPIR